MGLKIEAVWGGQAGGVVLAARYAPVRRAFMRLGYRQFVVIAAGLS